jgi:FkbM family methyltransferase
MYQGKDMSLLNRNAHLVSEAETFFGIMYYLKTDIPIGASIARYGEWSGIEIALHKNFIKDTSTVIDIGANIGSHTLAYARMAYHGRVFFFEPQPLLFSLIEYTLSRNSLSNVFGRNVAVASKKGQLFVEIPDYERLGNFGLPNTLSAVIDEVSSLKIEAIAIDDLALESCDFIKIDAEDATLDILFGMQKCIVGFSPHIALEILDIQAGWNAIQYIKECVSNYDVFFYRFKSFNKRNFAENDRNIFGVAEECGLLFSVCDNVLDIAIDGLYIVEVDSLDTLAREFLRTPRYGDLTEFDRQHEKISRLLVESIRLSGLWPQTVSDIELIQSVNVLKDLEEASNQAREFELISRETEIGVKEFSLAEREKEIGLRLRQLVGPLQLTEFSPTTFENDVFALRKSKETCGRSAKSKLASREADLVARAAKLLDRENQIETFLRRLVAPIWKRPVV